VWDLETLQQIGPVRSGHEGHVRAVAVTELEVDGHPAQPAVVSGSADGIIRVAWMATDQQIAVTSLGCGVRSLATTRLADTPVVISGDDCRQVRVRDAWRLTDLGGVARGPGEVRAVAAQLAADEACTWVAVAAGETVTLSLWTEGAAWRKVASVDLGADVLTVALPDRYVGTRRPGRVVVGATHGVVILEVAPLNG
jgi:hypothetical protein